MEDFANILQRDYGIKPQGKSAPMATSRAAGGFVPPVKESSNLGGSIGGVSPGLASRSGFSQSAHDGFGDDIFFGPANTSKISGVNSLNHGFGASKSSLDDVFGDSFSFGSSKQVPQPAAPLYDDIFSTPLQPSSTTSTSRSNSFPLYDMPRYDDDIFGGVPGVKSSSAKAGYEDVFGMGGVTSTKIEASDELLGAFGVAEPSRSKPQDDSVPPGVENSSLDELLPGFGPSEPAKKPSSGDGKPSKPSRYTPGFPVEEPTLRSADLDPFSGLTPDPMATFVDPLDPFQIKLRPAQDKIDDNLKSKMEGVNVSSYDPFDGFSQVKPTVAPQMSKTKKRDEDIAPPVASATNVDLPEADFVYSRKMEDRVENFPASPPGKEANEYFSNTASGVNSTKKRTVRFDEPTVKSEFSPVSESFTPDVEQRTTEEIWVTIDSVKLVTMPTTAPPPSRPAPRLDPGRKRTISVRRSEVKSEDYSETAQDHLKDQKSYATSSRVPTNITSIDDPEQFASGRFQSPPDMNVDFLDGDDQVPSAKMKEASERIEAKLRLAKEGREKDRDEKDRETKEARLREEKEEKEKEVRLNQEREAREREAREELERQRIRREKEREREREREKDRAAVERATQEARERAAEKAAAEARERAEKAAAEARQRAERAAVERVTAEARERAAAESRERAAVEARERAAAEAKEKAAMERAAAEAKERAAAERAAVERATAEARARAERAAVERANAEARERAAERAAVERAAAEARERAEKAAERAAVQRAAAEARERAEKAAAERATAERAAAAAAAAREQQQRRNDNDLETIFGMSGSRAASAPKQRPATPDFAPDQKVSSSDGQWRNSSAAPAVRKVSSTANITDDWTSLFATPATAEFQEIDGEAPERRKARLERYQRTQERAAKALAEKNQRDLDTQREQAEKHRAADMLDAEIKRWAAGKEGNLRALLSTLQYVLWPECGWQPVSLTDLITAPAVKKVYRKATLYVHPDKVQQKGATVQQKYVAEKVFDLLKEAWNKFNSEELF